MHRKHQSLHESLRANGHESGPDVRSARLVRAKEHDASARRARGNDDSDTRVHKATTDDYVRVFLTLCNPFFLGYGSIRQQKRLPDQGFVFVFFSLLVRYARFSHNETATYS